MKSGKLSIGLLVAAAAMLTMAFAASSASATEVVPAEEANPTLVELVSSKTSFYPHNAYSGGELRCDDSTATVEVPATGGDGQNNNINQTGVGTHSQGPGSVALHVQDPTFEDCGAFVSQTETQIGAVSVTVVDEPWSAAADQAGEELESYVAISVPEQSVEIDITVPGLGVCHVVIAPDQEQVVMGTVDNEASTLLIDGQVHFDADNGSATCNALGLNAAGASPAQFEGLYEDPTEELEVR